MQKSNKPSKIVTVLPLLTVCVLFMITWLLTGLGFRGSLGNCGYDWLWFLLWPVFFVSFSIALAITIILLIARRR